jgi:hypothetical protein
MHISIWQTKIRFRTRRQLRLTKCLQQTLQQRMHRQLTKLRKMAAVLPLPQENNHFSTRLSSFAEEIRDS